MMEESYEENTRKRSLEETIDTGYNNKRSNVASGKPLLKMLVPNFIAGKLIGKGGSNINELQTRFNASIQVSPNKEFYPGTEDRIVTISADTDQILEFSNYMIENVQEENDPERNTNYRHDVKLVVTNVAAGLVIGKGGATIKAVQEQSNAKINISKREQSVNGERVLVVSGDVQQRLKACSHIIEKMAAEPDKMSNSNIKYGSFNNSLKIAQDSLSLYNNMLPDGSNMLYNNMANNRHPMGGLGNYDHSSYEAKSKVKVHFQAQMEIPDSMVGSVLGKQGQTINEFSRVSGAKFQFSAKNDFAPGTSDRMLTITGGISQIHDAYILVDQKVAQVEAEFDGGLIRRS